MTKKTAGTEHLTVQIICDIITTNINILTCHFNVALTRKHEGEQYLKVMEEKNLGTVPGNAITTSIVLSFKSAQVNFTNILQKQIPRSKMTS